MSQLQQIWREAWRPPDRRPPWAWAEQHIGSIPYSPIPGRFRSDNSPQIREPLEALIDPRVRLVFIIAAIQSGKTSVGELGLCHIIANFPGPTLWLDQTDGDALGSLGLGFELSGENHPPRAWRVRCGMACAFCGRHKPSAQFVTPARC